MACAKIVIVSPRNGGNDMYHEALGDKYDIHLLSDLEQMSENVLNHNTQMVIINLLTVGTDGIDVLTQLKKRAELENALFLVMVDVEFEKTLSDDFWRKHLNVDGFLSSPITPSRIRRAVEELFIRRVNPRKSVGPGFL